MIFLFNWVMNLGFMLISRGVSRSLQQAPLCVPRSCFNFMKDSTTLSNRRITLDRTFSQTLVGLTFIKGSWDCCNFLGGIPIRLILFVQLFLCSEG